MESISAWLLHQALFYEHRVSKREPKLSVHRAEAYHSFVSKPTPMVIEILSDNELSDIAIILGF